MENDASFLELSEELASTLRQLPLDDATDSDQDEPADEAQQLFRWLGNLPSIDNPLEEWLEGAAEEAIAKAANLSKLVRLYVRKLKRGRKKQPELMDDAVVENATQAAGAMAYAVIEHTLLTLPPQHAQAKTLKEWLLALPAQAAMRQSQSVKRLLDTLSSGMERISGKNVSGKSAPERLVETSVRLQATARTLRSVDTLEPPAREESIELAREILRRLKKMSFSDKPLKEMIEAGEPQDKAAFAEQIDELADSYKNLLQEATELDPAIMQDQNVKEASRVVETFAHSVKLMAAKEMPGSIAAAQQISADATHNPDEWGQLHGRTVGRLLKSMEGALEKAVGGIEAEQQAQEDQQQAQEAALEAALHADHSHRRKRKRRGSSRSATSAGKKQAKQAHASDAKVAKEATMVNVMHGLNPEALAAVKQLGGALFKVSNQAKDIAATLANVAATDKITPDDKTATQRVIENELQKGPRNQGGPGV